ncbi:hypothetical protein SBV1_1420043 [Verrucomicrobia bacterium]|nr:hypothetical protein SBV1_1420043 [Verrucomicrobiota bacterium]
MLATPELMREAALPNGLGERLPRWLREVPLYRGVAASAASPATGLADLQRLPFITKADIRRDFPHNFLGANARLEQLLDQELVELEHTSGTSEERTPLLLGQGWWALQEQRALRLNPFVAAVLDQFPAARRVTISSPVCNSDVCYTGTPSRAERTVGNTLFLSLSRLPFLWGEADLARMAREAAAWEPQFLDVDPVYGVAFALYCERQRLRLPSLRFILCSYEFVSVNHRRILQRVFGLPVFNLYGSTETGHLLMEYPAALVGTYGDRDPSKINGQLAPPRSMDTEPAPMHPSLETAFLEVLNPDHSGVGELAVTTLTNDFMPLIRYRIGDLVERLEQPYWTRYLVHGRVADTFTTPDNLRVTTFQIDQCFSGISGIAHYELRGKGRAGWSLRLVPDNVPPAAAQLHELQRRVEGLLGPASAPGIQLTDLLLPESSGKFRLTAHST